MSIRIKRVIVVSGFLSLFILTPTANAQSGQVELAVSVREKKSTDTRNDFDFSYNVNGLEKIKEEKPSRNEAPFVQKFLISIRNIIKMVI
jgi:hypothetical protein